MERYVDQVVYFEAVCGNCLAKKNTKGMGNTTRPQFIAELEAEGWAAGEMPDGSGETLLCQSCKPRE